VGGNAQTPPVGARVVVRMEMVVVLRAPLGPNAAKTSPCSMANDPPSTHSSGRIVRLISLSTSTIANGC
jgi:hypothetical protein